MGTGAHLGKKWGESWGPYDKGESSQATIKSLGSLVREQMVPSHSESVKRMLLGGNPAALRSQVSKKVKCTGAHPQSLWSGVEGHHAAMKLEARTWAVRWCSCWGTLHEVGRSSIIAKTAEGKSEYQKGKHKIVQYPENVLAA